MRRRVVLLKYDIFRILSSSSRHGAGHSVAPKINTHVLVVLDTYGVLVFNLNLIYCRCKNTYMIWSWNFSNILPLNNIQYLLFGPPVLHDIIWSLVPQRIRRTSFPANRVTFCFFGGGEDSLFHKMDCCLNPDHRSKNQTHFSSKPLRQLTSYFTGWYYIHCPCTDIYFAPSSCI